MLKKEYKYIPPSDAAVNQPDEDGVSDALVNFDLKRDTEPSVSAFPGKAEHVIDSRIYAFEDDSNQRAAGGECE